MVVRKADWSWKGLKGTASATFSPCERYRYELTRRWGPKLGAFVFIGLNPSTATELELDPTITRVIGFAIREGFHAITMLNAFAWRSTDPAGLLLAENPIGPENDRFIENWADDPASTVCVGWGVHAHLMNRGANLITMLHAWMMPRKPVCLGRTKHGYPKHPLYLAATTPLEMV